MASVWKRVRKYERWVLIGIVVLMLATFSITGSVQGCSGATGQMDAYGGSYEPVPGRREDVSGIEFMALRARYAPIALSDIWGPTIRYASEVSGTQRSARLSQDLATWAHLVMVGAANAAGYHVGNAELKEGIETMVLRAVTRRDPRGSGVRFSPELYDQVVARFYPLPKADFETTVREILLKDKFLADVIDTQRFSRDPEDAYASWKAERERVDLVYFAVPAAQFKDAVELEEKTRTAVARQSELWHQVVRAALEVRRDQEILKKWMDANAGAPPASAQEFLEKEPAKGSLNGKLPKDPWGRDLVYVASGATSAFHSMGPDGKEGTPDDVGVAVLDTLQTMGALRRVGDGLETWMAAAKAWPASLADLTKSPPAEAGKPAPPPPLAEIPKDAWGHELAYVAAGPELSSLGADGAAGTADDLRVDFADGKAHVRVPESLKAFVLEDAKDAWTRPLSTELRSANPLLFETVSAGPDGKEGTDDDVSTGNSTDLLVYFNGVRTDYGLPQRREFEALYVVPALVSNETFAQAWKKFPELRPDEKAAWDLFRSSGIYRTRDEAPLAKPGEPAPEKPQDKDIDPADPEKGYAAHYLTSLREQKRLPQEAKGWQVPSPESLDDRKDPPAAGTAGATGLPMPEVDPLYKTYLDKGWRRVVLRDLFFDNLLSAALKTSREAAEARAKWEKEGKAGAAPPLVSLAETLAKYSELQPGEADSAAGARFLQMFSTKPGEPLSREDIEKTPDLGHYLLVNLLPSKDDQYAQIPVQIQDDGALRAALHLIKSHAPKQQELAEVRDKVWPKYLESRTMERASRELDRVRTDLAKQTSTGTEANKPPAEMTPEARLALVEKLVKDAAESRKFTFATGRTGPYRGGARGGRTTTTDPSLSAEAKKALAERAFTRAYGYDVVRTSGSGQGAKALEVGTIGRTVLRDDRGPDVTGEAYLVQVAWRQDPTPEEFTGRQYLQWLAKAAYDQHEEWTPTQEALTHRSGFMLRAMSVGYDDIDRLKAMFSIRTPTPLEMPKNTN